MKMDFGIDGMEILVSFFSEENRASTNLYGDIPKR
jgi:hypothetical protein